MKVIITGGGGFLGQVLAKEIISRGQLRSETEQQKVTEIILADIVQPKELLFPILTDNPLVKFHVGDVSSKEYCDKLLKYNNTDDGLSIFHLGAVMSGTGEANFDLAMSVNLQGTMNILEAARNWQASNPNKQRPTLIFTSAGATIGSGHEADWVSKEDVISDATRATPHTTYGMTKACCELLLSDYSRRNFIDGRGVRLPTVVVRAGAPNAATTSCFSAVVREPLKGIEAVLPIDASVLHACTGYRAAVEGILNIHDADPEKVDKLLGFDRTVFLPSSAISLGQLAEAMHSVVAPSSKAKLGKVTYDVNTFLSDVVGGFPTMIDASRALQLGAPPTPDLETLVREYCEDFPSDLAPGLELIPAEVSGDVGSKRDLYANGKGTVVLITGGGSGIGRAVAIRLARGEWGGYSGKGKDVDGNTCCVGIVLVGRRRGALEETAEMCKAAAAESELVMHSLVVPADLTKESQVNSMFNTLEDYFGRLDVLFNNAGMNIPPQSVEDIDLKDWQRVVDINLTACWMCARGAMKIMGQQEPRGGRIINNGSVSADRPRPFAAPYTSTKHAVMGLTKSIALDGRKIDVACGQIDFGNVTSALTAKMAEGMPQADGSTKPEPTFCVADASQAVHTMAALPLNANVLQMTIMATNMPFVGRG